MPNKTIWMEEIGRVLGPKSLRAVVFPGTHDSGTSLIDANSGISPDAPAYSLLSKLPKQLIGPAIAAFSKTQPTTVLDQLQAGIRYFDLRVCMVEYSQELYIVHSMYSHKLEQVLSEIERFIKKSSREIIIIDFQHFYKMDEFTHKRLAKTLLSKFRDRLIPRSVGVSIPIKKLWDRNWQVIVLYGEDVEGGGAATAAAEPLFWTRANVQSKWRDTDDVQKLKNGLEAELSIAPSDKLFVLQAILSPNEGTILSHVTSGSPHSLEEMARTLAPRVPAWIAGDWTAKPVNIVIIDWFNQSNFVDACITSNLR